MNVKKAILAWWERIITHPLVLSIVLTILFITPFGFESFWVPLIALPQFLYVAYLVLLKQNKSYTWKEGLFLLILLVAAFILRYEFVIRWSNPDRYLYSDMVHYVHVADSWLQGIWTVPHAIKPLGYSLIIMGSKYFFGSIHPIYFLHFFCMIVTVIAPWRAVARVAGEFKGFIVLFLLIFHVPLYSIAEFVMPDILFAALLALTFYYCVTITIPLSTKDALVLGTLFGVTLWLKANNLLFGPLFVFWILWHWYRETSCNWKKGKPFFKSVILFSLPMVLSIAMHGIFTYQKMGRVLLSSTNGGLSFVEGKCPSKINIDSQGMGWHSSLYVQLGESEKKIWARPFDDQAYYYREGLNCIVNNPGVLIKGFRYVYFLFYGNTSWPANTARYKLLDRDYDMFAQMLFYPGLFVFLILLCLRGNSPYSVSALIVLSLVLNSWIFKAEMRYRQPFDVILIPFVVLGWDFILTKLAASPVIYRRLVATSLGIVVFIGGFVTYRLVAGF